RRQKSKSIAVRKVNQPRSSEVKQSRCQQLKKDCTFDVKPRRDGWTAGQQDSTTARRDEGR
ncbi:MAG TPA: hypothetical protein DCY25_07945, partial [Bacteroidales bacterium]|nr:hypothetical protein [Bacteroidales bacterium]